MKRLKYIHCLFLSLFITLVGCVPDSLTKYEEESSTNKSKAGGSSDTPASGAVAPEGCVANTYDGGGCTSITSLDYTEIESSKLHISLGSTNIGEEIASQNPTLGPSTADGILFTSFSVAPALPNDLSLNASTGSISGIPQGYAAATTHTITAVHGITNSSALKSIEIAIATELAEVVYNQQVGSMVILQVSDVIGSDSNNPRFSAIAPPANTINLSNSSGALGIIRYVDQETNELHVEIATGSTGNFANNDGIDNNSTFFISEDTISDVTIALDKAVGFIGGSITPVLSPVSGRTLTATELAAMRFSISPSIPTGMSFDTTTGIISGTPTSNITKTEFTISAKNILDQSVSISFNLSILDVPTPKTIKDVHYDQSAADYLAIKVNSINSFFPKDTLEGTVTVSAAGTTVTGSDTRFQSELIAGAFIKIGNEFHTVASIADDTTLTLSSSHEAGTVGTKIVPISWFITALDDNDTPSDPSDDSSASAHIKHFNSEENELVIEVISGQFKPGMTLSSGPTYLSNVDEIQSVQYVFSTTQSPSLSPTLSPHVPADDAADIASVTYTITPNIPSETGLSFNTSTGVISGTAPLSSFEGTFTVKATSLNQRSKEKEVKIFIQPALTKLSLTNQVLLTVDSTSKFLNGDLVSSPGEDNNGSAKGIVKEVIDSTKLLVQVTSGKFLENTGLDNLKDYHSEKTRIITVKNNSAILTVAGAPTTGSTITSSGGAVGIVNHSTASKVYVRTTSGTWVTDETIGGNAITNLWSAHMKFKVNGGGVDATKFFAGSDVITARCYDNSGNDVTAAGASDTKAECEALYGTCYNAEESIDMSLAPTNLTSEALCDPTNTTRIWKSNAWRAGVSVVNETEDSDSDGDIDFLYVSYEAGDFKETDPLDNQNPFDCTPDCPNGGETNIAAAQLQIDGTSGISTDEIFSLKVGVLTSIQPSLATGETASISYSIVPDLPSGLTLNSTTGVISGTPTELLTKTKYTIVASSKLGSATYDFHLKVHSTFGIVDESSKSVYAFHKLGHGRKLGSPCEITQDQVDAALLSGDNKTRDITCILEAGEKDLKSIGASLNFNVSPGICNHVTHVPFQFYNRAPHKSSGATYINNTGNILEATCIAANGGAIAEWDPYEPTCQGNYDNDSGTISCDEGTFNVSSQSWVYDSTAGTCSVVITPDVETKCNGKARECIEGPVRDIGIDYLDNVGVTAEAISGYTPTTPFTYRSATNYGVYTNKRIANFTKNNSCAASDYEYQTTNWDNYTDTTSISDPFQGGNPYYTFNCLDDSQEIIARINVLIRDWDRDFDVSDPIDQLSAGRKVDTGAQETDSFGSSLNDVIDWDNQGSLLENCSSGTPTYAAASIVSLGNGTVTSGNNIITGTNLEGNVFPGDRITLDRGGADEETLIVSTVNSNTSLTTTQNFTNTTGTHTLEVRKGVIATLAGTISATKGSSTITGVGTSFTTEIIVGDRLLLDRGAASEQILIVSEIISDTILVVGRIATSDYAAGALEVVELPQFPASAL